jgi:hypothetical protein
VQPGARNGQPPGSADPRRPQALLPVPAPQRTAAAPHFADDGDPKRELWRAAPPPPTENWIDSRHASRQRSQPLAKCGAPQIRTNPDRKRRRPGSTPTLRLDSSPGPISHRTRGGRGARPEPGTSAGHSGIPPSDSGFCRHSSPSWATRESPVLAAQRRGPQRQMELLRHDRAQSNIESLITGIFRE